MVVKWGFLSYVKEVIAEFKVEIRIATGGISIGIIKVFTTKH